MSLTFDSGSKSAFSVAPNLQSIALMNTDVYHVILLFVHRSLLLAVYAFYYEKKSILRLSNDREDIVLKQANCFATSVCD